MLNTQPLQTNSAAKNFSALLYSFQRNSLHIIMQYLASLQEIELERVSPSKRFNTNGAKHTFLKIGKQ